MKKDETIWRSVKGYEGLYEANNKGLIKGIKRQGSKGAVLKPVTNAGGYLQVALRKEGKSRSFLVHRLVAGAFLEQSEDRIHVNHINGDKKDNRIENLEWCTPQENSIHRHYTLKKNVKPVICVETGVEYPSIREASRQLGIGSKEISNCCRGVYRYKTAGGFHWKYKNKEDITNEQKEA